MFIVMFRNKKVEIWEHFWMIVYSIAIDKKINFLIDFMSLGINLHSARIASLLEDKTKPQQQENPWCTIFRQNLAVEKILPFSD